MHLTELMNKILTSEEAQKIIRFVSPIYGNSYVGLWLLQVIGAELDDMKKWSEELREQTSPYTATWGLYLWEQEYNVTPAPDWTIEQRRQAIISKIRYKAPMNPAKMSELASALTGVPVDIVENTGKNKFSVYVRKNIPIEKFAAAKEAIDRAKPAHLIYDINIAETREVQTDFYMGVGAEINKYYEVEVI